MKSVVFLLLIALMFLPIKAKERNLAKKQSIALSVLTNPREWSNTRSSSVPSLLTLDSTDVFSVIGYEKGGFVIIPNDDAYPSVLGYSHKKYQTSNASGFSWWKAAIEQVLNDASYPSHVSAMSNKTAASPLLKSLWGQNSPYNNLCPSDQNGELYPSGCVATAMAQVMKYHGYPAMGKGTGYYNAQSVTTQVTFEGVNYDWENMLDVYVKGQYSDEQANAVATLMLHCGASVQMQYNSGGSGAYSYNAARALKNSFGYSDGLQMKYRDYYSTSEWMSLVYGEIDAMRPIIYSGMDVNNGGHCFVIDGYDEQGLVHVNWGWDGVNDGYYNIELLNPSSYTFSKSQSMIYGVGQPEDNIEYQSEVVSTSDFEMTRFQSKLILSDGNYYNFSYQAFNGTFAYILVGNNTTEVLASSDNQNVSMSLSLTKPIVSFVQLPSELSDGTYRIYPAVRSNQDKRWIPIHFSEGIINSWLIEKSGNNITISPVTDVTWHSIATKIVPIKVENNLENATIFTIDGRKVEHSISVPKGVYILQGKKIMK